MTEKIAARLDELISIDTAHTCGLKTVFLTKQVTQTNFLQFSLGELKESEVIETDKHPTMK